MPQRTLETPGFFAGIILGWLKHVETSDFLAGNKHTWMADDGWGAPQFLDEHGQMDISQ